MTKEKDPGERLHGTNLHIAETWFKWMEWALIVTAIAFAAEKTGSRVLNLLSYISLAALALHVESHIRHYLQRPLVRSDPSRRVTISVALVAVLMYGVMMLIMTTVRELIASSQP